ncbi:MAG: hypothetical protein IH936_12660 [Acidobacteria bacterium]|nr:hypothetical protein [Acidobacteriota bacterium]
MTVVKLGPTRLLLLFLLAGVMPQPAEAADIFYTRLLERGVRDLELGMTDEAQKKLRTACFGFLDEPVLLAEGLMQLGRAQALAGNAADLTDTAERLVEIEDRFNAYSSFNGDLKTLFESSLRSALRDALLKRMPLFIHLTAAIEPTAQKAKPLTPRQRRKATGRLAKSAATLATATEEPSTQASAESGQETKPAIPQQIEIDPTLEERMRRLRGEVSENRFREQLEKAMRRAIELADEHSDSAEAQHLAAEIAYLSSDWPLVVDYFDRGGKPSTESPELLFYLAVAIYELGDAQEAASILRTALPSLPRNSFVDSYIDKILTSPN